MTRPRSLDVPQSVAIGVCALLAYVLVSLGVENLFPFSTFPMYAAASPSYGARLVVRDGRGRYAEIVRYERWSCEGPLTAERVARATCDDGSVVESLDYLSHEALSHIRATAATAPDGEDLELILRAWRIDDVGALHEHDCPVTRCRASEIR